MGMSWLSCDHKLEFVLRGNKQPSLNMMENTPAWPPFGLRFGYSWLSHDELWMTLGLIITLFSRFFPSLSASLHSVSLPPNLGGRKLSDVNVQITRRRFFRPGRDLLFHPCCNNSLIIEWNFKYRWGAEEEERIWLCYVHEICTTLSYNLRCGSITKLGDGWISTSLCSANFNCPWEFRPSTIHNPLPPSTFSKDSPVLSPLWPIIVLLQSAVKREAQVFCINPGLSGSEFNCTFLWRFHEPESRQTGGGWRRGRGFILTCRRVRRQKKKQQKTGCSRCCRCSRPRRF